MADNKFVSLVVTAEVFTPYKRDEVFTLPAADAEKVLEKAGDKVRKFDPKKDADLAAKYVGGSVAPEAPAEDTTDAPKEV